MFKPTSSDRRNAPAKPRGSAIAASQASYPAEIEAAVAHAKGSPAEEDYSRALSQAPKHSFTGVCMYCGHCAPCTADIDIALVSKYLDLAQAQPELPETMREHYRVLR